MRKCAVLMLIAVLAASNITILTVTPATAQEGFKLSIPQISSIKFVDSSYDVPSYSTTTIDQYTGKEVITITPGYHVDQVSIELTIKNQQPFTTYANEIGLEVNLYYIVEVKGHFGEYWTSFGYAAQSNSGYTVVSSVVTYFAESQLDFRVQATIGFTPPPSIDGMMGYWGAIGVYGVVAETRSEWSGVQTFIVPDGPSGSASPSQTATLSPLTSAGNSQLQSPDQMQSPNNVFTNRLLFLLVVCVLLGGVVVGVVVLLLRRR
ncbi:MAG: hypothetical protein LBH62_03235 [Nitrososphaerota archaeon]|nr:hypothetical protein [Nitrososphaerota archaeon]